MGQFHRVSMMDSRILKDDDNKYLYLMTGLFFTSFYKVIIISAQSVFNVLFAQLIK